MSTVLDGPTAPGGRGAVPHPAGVAPDPLAQGGQSAASAGQDATAAAATLRPENWQPEEWQPEEWQPEEWQPVAAAHAERADALTAVWRAARAAGRKHAIEDFLFTYYPTRIAHLRRWHPGAGVALLLPGTGERGAADGGTADNGTAGSGTADSGTVRNDATGSGASDVSATGRGAPNTGMTNSGTTSPAMTSPATTRPATTSPGTTSSGTTSPGTPDPDDRTTWRWHRTTRLDGGAVVVELDADAYLADRGDTVRYVRDLLAATASRPGTFGCFGLHEWAMVYRDREAGRDQRHPLPLRLGHAGTDAVVEANPVRCSHFDAFRFFTPEATSRNQLQPTRAAQVGMEQPGCLHANMDLYKWCLKLGPVVPGDLLLDAFELARDIRWTDMAASPYDVSEYDVPAVQIETPHGKAEYVRRQREFAQRSGELRQRLLRACDAALGAPLETP